jgi:peroxiredoxin
MPGCPGTERATEFLSLYARSKPHDVAIMRVDVPPPGGTLPALSTWKAPFGRVVDKDRSIAGKLEFFFYPTFYIIDRDGGVRFSGQCRPGEVEKMVREIGSEKPGAAKHLYSSPMPKIGAVAHNFTGTTVDNKRISLAQMSKGKVTLLFFGSTSCPFSMKATESLPGIVSEFRARDVAFAIIDKGSSGDSIKAFYGEKAPGIPVIIDKEGAISEKEFGVSAVPFFFVLDKKGTIVQRKPFTPESARSALSILLGIKNAEKQKEKSGAG